MLTTIIYRSHLADEVPVSILPGMVGKASLVNARYQVTGILLFNGTHFFQILEGPEEGVLEIYGRICADRRHHNVVELMRDYSPSRRFGNHGMELFDLRQHDRDSVLQAVLARGTSKYRLTYDDRGLQFLRTFVEARDKEDYFEVLPADYWVFVPVDSGSTGLATSVTFRPVVDPLGREVTAIEAIPDAVPAGLSGEALFAHNFCAVTEALRRAGRSCPDDIMLYVSILPMTLIALPDAISLLVSAI